MNISFKNYCVFGVVIVAVLMIDIGTVSADFKTIDFSSSHNARMQDFSPANAKYFPEGDVVLGGVPFSITSGTNNIWQASGSGGVPPYVLDIVTNEYGVDGVYTLINTHGGVTGGPYVWLEFFGTNGAYYKKGLYGDDDIRDYYENWYTNNINGTTTVNVFKYGSGYQNEVRLDKQWIDLPAYFDNEILTGIRLTDDGAPWPNQFPILAGVTVEYLSEPEPLTGRIAFGSHHPDEPMRLWVMDASVGLSSKVEVPLPQTFRVLDCTEWSRDGTWITFYAAKTGEWNCGIYVVKPDGSGFCQVTPDGMDLAHPSFSSDASQIIGCTSFYRLYICTKVGECDWVTEYLTRGVHPKWSPEGNKITYSNWGLTYESDIFVYDLNTNTSIQITNHDPGKPLNRAVWSPDGTKLAVAQNDHQTYDICIMNSDGSDLWNLTSDWAVSNERYPSWSPDGQYIVFSSDISGNFDIWYTPADHFDPVNIINSPEDEYMAAITIAEPAEPDIDVSPLSHDFGDVELGTSRTVIVTISNVGNGDLTVSGIGLETDFAITSAPDSAIVVEPSQTEYVEITYTPSALGYNSAVLKISSDDPDEPVVEVQLSAVGIEIPLPPLEQIANILAFFDTSVDDGILLGDGPGNSAEKRLNALRNMIEAAGDLIENELFEEACQQLLDAYRRMDGQPKPPDFVTGEAVTELATMIQELMTTLGC